MNKLQTAVESSRQIYTTPRPDKIASTRSLWEEGTIDTYQYISEMYENSKILFDLSNSLQNIPITNISVDPHRVIFTIELNNLQFEVDRSCRSALLETLNFGGYELDDEEMICRLLDDGPVIFDIGAHIGWSAIRLSTRLERSRVLAFEPLPTTFNVLKRNVSINNINNIDVFPFGFSNRRQRPFFFYDELGSPLASQRNISDLPSCKKVRVRLNCLDDFLESGETDVRQVDFIKCDVEGAELLVLKGGERCLKRFHPILLLELVNTWCKKFKYSPNDIIHYLSLHGYLCFACKLDKLKQIRAIALDEDAQFNYFFLHKDKHRSQIAKFSRS